MKQKEKQYRRRPSGIWIALVALLLTCLAWIMQLYSLLNWEAALEFGIQNDSFSGDNVERTLANVERGVALADMVWALPLSIVALVGILNKRQFGMIAAMMVFAISVYFPLFFAFQRWNTHQETAIAALFLFAIPSLIGISALWSNRKLFI